MGRFDDFVRQAEVALPILPLCHTCEAIDFRQIMRENKLDVTECPHFNNQPLLYFFYGKPAYRTAKDDQATSANAFLPVAILVRSELQQGLERIAPFDTGAYGMYSRHTHPKMQCEDFLLAPNLSTPGRVVSRFFGTNKNYFDGTPTRIVIPPLEFEAFSYQELIHDKSSTQYDDRRNLIELQFSESLSLDANVLLVVLPGIFLDIAEVQATLVNRWKAEIRHYRTHHGNPRDYVSDIYGLVEDYLKSNSYI